MTQLTDEQKRTFLDAMFTALSNNPADPDTLETIEVNWIRDIEKDLEGSERSCAVLAGAILDEKLVELLKKYLLKPDQNGRDKLLGQSNPLGTFSGRIELSRRLHLITKETRQSLDWIREIRNHASHSPRFSFSEDRIRDRITNLTNILKIDDYASALVRPGFNDHRGKFVAAVILLGIYLELEVHNTGETVHVPKYSTLNLKFIEAN